MKTFSEWSAGKDKVCVITRGIPGSGKSYQADQILKQFGVSREGHIFNTDDFFYQGADPNATEDEKLAIYRKNWNGQQLGVAHAWNFNRFKQAVDAGVSPVIVDNVNSMAQHAKNYVQYAKQNGYEIVIQEPTSDWWLKHKDMLTDKQKYAKELDEFAEILFKKNQHGVPLATIKGMIQKWQPNLKPEDFE